MHVTGQDLDDLRVRSYNALDERQLARVQQLLREELPAIPMAFKPVVVVHRIGVRGLQPTGGAAPLAWNAATWSMAPLTSRH